MTTTEDENGRLGQLARETRMIRDLQRIGIRAVAGDRAQTIVLSFDDVEALLAARQANERRTRPRDVLVAQLTSMFLTTFPDRMLDAQGLDAAGAAAFRETLAERVLDALGVAVLVTGSPQSTDRTVGEVEELSLEEVLERRGTPERRDR